MMQTNFSNNLFLAANAETMLANTCSHPMVLGSICINCRHEVSDQHCLRFDYIIHGLKLTKTEVDWMRNMETDILLSKKKLILVLDLDETLLQTTRDSVTEYIESLQDVIKVKLPNSYSCTVKLRPFVLDFLEQASTMFELYVYTNSRQAYATEMVKLLDPDNKYFNSRLISRDDSTESGTKNLDIVMGQERAVVILDDRTDVWPNHNANVIQVQNYEYFSPRVGKLKSKSFARRKTDEDIKIMETYWEILKSVHSQFFYDEHDDPGSRDVRAIMRGVQGEILNGCRLILRNNSTDKNQILEVQRMAEKMGAICVLKMDPSVTHVVFMEARPEDDGLELLANKKKKKKRAYHSVLSRWIFDCYKLWHKLPFEDYMA
ncbi:RNA polymerase II C-terminal domain phosphatase-like 4 [Mercurialis annua]|uniref:RNA polymerase II C-terminal domain phosphatase-like 4 n=1 Tax=Mercurialis annua TaxID=3986 RepID=UPI0021604690|nr:RNA polymerase II C-terminal domain phosphatase-like 4 [Mercurialis annua]